MKNSIYKSSTHVDTDIWIEFYTEVAAKCDLKVDVDIVTQ